MHINIGTIRREINKMPVGTSIVKPVSPFLLIYNYTENSYIILYLTQS